MTTENLQINIGANTQDLQAGLNQASQSINNFSSQLNKAAKPTADATNALTNLSRVAQDAPYGFMGIANNLNPMLESFQRLQKESGSTSNALKSMAAGLAGPAGLGVALGVVSSLVVAFGDEISDFFSKLTSGSASLQETNKAFHDSKDAFTKAYVEMQNLGNSFEAFHNNTKSKKSVLEEYNNTLGKVYGTTKDINEAEKLYTANSDSYVKAAMYRAAAQVAMQKAAEQAFKQQELLANPKSAGGFDLNQNITSGLIKIFSGADVQTITQLKAVDVASNKAKSLETVFLNIANSFNAMVESTNNSAQKSVLFGKETESKDKKDLGEVQNIVEKLKEAEKSLDYQLSKGMISELNKDDKDKKSYYSEKIDAISDAIKKLAGLTSGEAKNALALLEKELSSTQIEELGKKRERFGVQVAGAMSERSLDPNKTNRNISAIQKDIGLIEGKNDTAKAKELEKELTDAQKSAEKFAHTLSRDVTGALFGMWDAMQQGQNPLQALGDMFTNLAKKIAEAAIEAAIFQAIMMAFGGGGESFSGGFIGGFQKLLGFADGGVVSQPTLAMVGEGGQSEAIMPLNKLGNMLSSTFSAGAMSGGGGGGNGQFVLKGNDLILAINRSNASLNLRRGF